MSIMSLRKKFIYLTLLTVIFCFSSCKKEKITTTTTCIKGEGSIVTSSLSVGPFTGIDLAMSSNVTVKEGATFSVQATGHPNIIDLVSTSVSNGIWVISFKNHECISNYQLSFEITIPSIKQIISSGSGDILVNNFSNESELNIDMKGSGNLILNEFEGITEFDVRLSGSGSFTGNNDISNLDTLKISNTGSGNYLAFAINSNNCTVNSSGSGDCEVTVQNTLNTTISGSGNVSYKGSPTIIQNITGSGSLINAN